MLASNRGIIFAFIAALILLGAAQPSQPPAERELPESAAGEQRPVAETSETNVHREPPDPGCPNGGDNRQSDLCAQWKAADAARDAANASWIQTYTALTGLLIAFGTLIFAGLAARWAGKAALEAEGAATAARDAVVETKAANKIAQQVGTAQTRGYLAVAFKGWSGQFSDPKPLGVQIALKNWGQSPCSGVSVKRGIFLLPYPLENDPSGLDHGSPDQKLVVWPTQELDPFFVPAERLYTEAELADALRSDGLTRIYLVVNVQYEDFDGNPRCTRLVQYIEPTSIQRINGLVATWSWAIYPEYNSVT